MLSSGVAIGRCIGAGRCADVHEFGPGRAVKLFRGPRAIIDIVRERHNGRVVRIAGLPAPAVGDIVECENRPGIVLERIPGGTMEQALLRAPWTIPRQARRLAELQRRIHHAKVPTLPWQIERLAGHIRNSTSFTLAEQRELLARLYRLPLGASVCHHDLVPANVIAGPDGLIAIDWFGAAQGHPLGCVASTSMKLNREQRRASRLFKLAALFFRHLWLEAYFRPDPGLRRQLPAWEIIRADTDTFAPERARLRRFVRRRLAQPRAEVER